MAEVRRVEAKRKSGLTLHARKRPVAARHSAIDMKLGFPRPRQQFVEMVYGISVDHAREHIAQVGVGLDVIQLAGLCRPPNYAERFWMRPIVCPNLRPVERTSPKFHSA
jgi:hypothetical protein